MKYIKITSTANPLIKEALKIKEKPGRDKDRVFLIEGPHLVEMAASSPQTVISRVFFTEAFASRKEGGRLLRHAAKKALNLTEVSEKILSRLADTGSPQGVIAIGSYRPVALSSVNFKGAPFLVVCDGLRDPGNVGALIRVADASGADAVVILPGTCDPFMPKAMRSTAGSLFNIPIVFAEPDALFDYLYAENIKLLAADVHASRSLYDADLKQAVAIAFGNEAHGISSSLLKKTDVIVKIPIMGRAESLNVAAAASVCLYEAVRQRTYQPD